MHALWFEGTDHGLVWSHGMALVSGEVSAHAAAAIWAEFGDGGDLAGFLKLLSIHTGTDVLSLPDFAIALRTARGDWQLAARGTQVAQVEDEVVRGAGITTWAERSLPGGSAACVGRVGDAAQGRPLVAGLVVAAGLAWGDIVPAEEPAAAQASDAAVEPAAQGDAEAGEDAMVQVPADALPAAVVAPAGVAPLVVPPTLDTDAPVVADADGPAPLELPDWAAGLLGEDAPASDDDDASGDPVSDEVAAPDGAGSAGEDGPQDEFGSEDESEREFGPEDEAEREFDPDGDAHEAPSGTDAENQAPVDGEDAHTLDPVWSGGDDEDDRDDDVHDQADVETRLGDPDDEHVLVDVPAVPAQEAPSGRFSRQYGDTEMFSVEDAAVRPGGEAEFIAGVPGAEGPASSSGEDDHDGGEGDHDGHTMLAAEFAAQQASPSAEPTPEPAADGPPVLGVRCPQGHANPPHRGSCFDCGAPLTEPAQQLPRPPLGRLKLPSGETIPLTTPVIVGRNPRVDRYQGPVLPRLVPLSQGHVSSNHLELRLEEWNVLAVDLHSTNGTFLRRRGEAPVRLGERPEILMDGDVLDLGHGVHLTLEGLR